MFVLWACWEEASAPNWTIWLSANIQKKLCRSDTDTASSLDNISKDIKSSSKLVKEQCLTVTLIFNSENFKLDTT